MPAPAWTYILLSLIRAMRSTMQVSISPTAEKIADAAGVGAALLLLQLVDDPHGAHLGGARHVRSCFY
jgi:hypothetical protein